MAVPTNYIAGLNVLVRSIAAGIDPVFMAGDHFTPERFADATRRLSIPERFTALVPAQLAVLLDDRDGASALRDLSAVLVGGQAAPRAVLDRAANQGVHVIRTYGSTETCGGCVYDGSPIGMTAVDVVDGEVWLSGPTLAEGYLARPDLTDERFPTRDGVRWYATNDTGSWDGARLTVTGRLDDIIISGGVKVSLGEVERLIREHCGFPDVVVVAVKHAKWGEAPAIVTTGDTDFANAISAVGIEIGREARPARVIRVDALPMLPSGKVDRVAVAAIAERAAE